MNKRELTIERGQIWADRDKRRPDRKVEVLDVLEYTVKIRTVGTSKILVVSRNRFGKGYRLEKRAPDQPEPEAAE